MECDSLSVTSRNATVPLGSSGLGDIRLTVFYEVRQFEKVMPFKMRGHVFCPSQVADLLYIAPKGTGLL